MVFIKVNVTLIDVFFLMYLNMLLIDDAKAEIDNLFNKNKAKWEAEIEQAFERLKKVSQKSLFFPLTSTKS